RFVVVVVKTRLRRISGEDEVLAIIVRNDHLLFAVSERVELAIGVLFLLIEPDEIELIAIREARPEETHRAVRVAENEPAKIARERLRPGANGDKIVVGPDVCQFPLDEVLFERPVLPEPVRAVEDIGTDDAQLPNGEVIDVKDRREPDLPVDR